MDASTPEVALPATSLKSKDLLGIAELTPEEILLILDTTEAMKEISQRQIKKVPALRGRTVVNLFFEASTRTRTSFEIAEKRLSADTLGVAVASSSVVKVLISSELIACRTAAVRPAICALLRASTWAEERAATWLELRPLSCLASRAAT